MRWNEPHFTAPRTSNSRNMALALRRKTNELALQQPSVAGRHGSAAPIHVASLAVLGGSF